jgi:hypothetical protein
MNTKRASLLLTIVNLLVVLPLLSRSYSATSPEVTPLLRARALELVDDQGRVRAELKVMPADPKVKMPDSSTGYPETVLFRLISSKGAPNIKVAATEDGGGVVVGAGSGYVQVLSRGEKPPFVKLVTKDGKEHIINP